MNVTTAIELDSERSICQRYAHRVRAYGLCHLRDSTAAEDLLQQVLLTVLQALRSGRVNEVDNLDKYVFGTCRNTVMGMRRGQKRQQRIADATEVALPTSYELAWELADRDRLDQCLAHLEPRARAVILATFVDEREAEEIGRSMNLSAGNVRVIRHRALAHLEQCMKERGREV